MNSFLRKFDRFPFWLWVALSFLGYLTLALWFPLVPYYDQLPLSDVRSLAPSLAGGLAYAGLLSLLFVFFAMAYRHVCQGDVKLPLAKLIGIAFFFALPLLLVYPINANDIYRYVVRGRVQSLYGQDPFSVPADSFAHDPFLPFAGEWAGVTSPYGPLWEGMASALTRISGDSLLFGILAFKLLALLAFLGSAALFWLLFTSRLQKAGRDDAFRAARTLLWAWNPALLLIFVANGHNDALMIFFLLLGYTFIHRGQEETGYLLMLLGPLVKPVGALALPIILISIWRRRPSLSARLRFLTVVVFGGLLLVFLAFLPFGSPLQLGQRLLQEAAAGASFSPATTIILIGQAMGLEVGSLLRIMTQVMPLLFLLFVLWLLWLTWRGRSVLKGTADIFLGYLLQALNFRIWYAAWPFPWLLLDAGADRQIRHIPLRLRYGLWFLFTSQLSVIIYGHARVLLLDGSQLWAHLIGMAFVFGLPFVLAQLSRLGRITYQE